MQFSKSAKDFDRLFVCLSTECQFITRLNSEGSAVINEKKNIQKKNILVIIKLFYTTYE